MAKELSALQFHIIAYVNVGWKVRLNVPVNFPSMGRRKLNMKNAIAQNTHSVLSEWGSHTFHVCGRAVFLLLTSWQKQQEACRGLVMPVFVAVD